MSVSQEEVGALLLKWQGSGQSIKVRFSSEAETWQRSGKIVHPEDVQLGTVKVSWDDGGSQFIPYSPACNISEDGRSLLFLFSSGDGYVMFKE
jgi:hypothetical protein